MGPNPASTYRPAGPVAGASSSRFGPPARGSPFSPGRGAGALWVWRVRSSGGVRCAGSEDGRASGREGIGSMTCDELVCERDQIQARLAVGVEERTKAWGIHVDAIRLLDINMPEELKRMMSRQASAEREKRATITKAEGDRGAPRNLASAAM